MIFRRLPVLFFVLLLTTGLSAQQFGGNPPSLHWQQINTDTARIIFPKGLESPARQVAAIVHTLSRTTLPTIGGQQRKINIVFQNQTIIPNGYVGLAPFRSEFQLTPEQNSLELGSLPWQKTLAIHEYRHVQQYNNYRIGLSKAFYYLFGEGGQALANSLSIPNWFWEGDAVYQETLVSDQGRGRLPFFFSSYRSLWAADKRYSWMKLRNGSFRDYIPDHYPLGYMLVAYGRQHYGDDFWKNVTLDAARFKGLFFPLQAGIKRYASVSFTQFRRDALDHFKATEPHQTEMATADEFARTHRHFQGNQQFPRFIGQDSLLYLSSSYRKIPAFIIKDMQQGHEHKLRSRAIAIDDYFSYGGGKIVYAAYETDPRWSWRDYSVIRMMDAMTGEDRRLTVKSRYFAPDISPDGGHIVAVQVSTDGGSTLHLLDTATGAVEQRLPNKDSLFYTYPKFYGKDKIITAVRNARGEMSLALVHVPDGAMDLLLPFSYQAIAFPSVRGDTVWFTASRENENRIYCFTGEKLFRVRLPHGEPITGDYGFNATEGGYAWSAFTAVGYRADAAPGSQLQLEPLAVARWQLPLAIQGIDSLDKGPSRLLDRIGKGDYPVKKYPGSFHIFNFHSWRPYISDPDYTFSLVSENILNTLQSELFFDYNRNEKYKQVGVDATYGALFPWLDIGVNYIFDRNTLTRSGKAYFNEANAYIGYSIPLNWTHGRSFTGIQFGTDLVYSRQYFQGLFKDSGLDRHFTYLRNYLSFTNQIQKAAAQIYPRLAQTVYLLYDQSVSSTPSHQFLASGYFYLPGVDLTHSLQLGAAWQGRDKAGAGSYSNGFPWARGYAAYNLYQMWRLTANYHFPLLYPDAGFANMIYLMRIRANCFYDYMKGAFFNRAGDVLWFPFRSYGVEMFFDTKWWNQLPISFGVRYSRLVDLDIEGRGPNQWELILPLNILSQGYSAKGGAKVYE
ncbi:MAG: hypothetical protein J0H74_06525 [Chitinophagaceae bacterium]|nr:hypothetical protein [Chitinophagaceae bacterium]